MSHGTCFPFFDSESQPNLAVDSESQPNLAVESWCLFSPKMRDFSHCSSFVNQKVCKTQL